MGGKGRTGTCICALLVYAGALTALEAVRWYARYRGGFNAGLTIPSQVRWIAMFEHVCRLRKAQKSVTPTLLSDPFSKDSHIAYRLVRVQCGPVGAFWSKVFGGTN